jgi:hypothetical protein
MEEIYFGGIGSRETPENVLKIMTQLGYSLAKKDFILRSGGANGADLAFENGCDKANGKKEIYLPWKGFNDSKSDLYYENLPKEATDIAFEHHPGLYKCKYGVIKLMARNTCQVLGKDCKTPSNFIICYCKVVNNKPTGGTSQAIRVAEAHKIPVFNLFFKEELDKLKVFIQELETKRQKFILDV